MESKKINQLATELAPDLSDLTIIGDPTTGISKKITLSQMASLFTGTVEEYANLAAFPLVGVADTIYIALDTNILYRWNTGTSAYVELSPNIVSSLVFNDANGFDGTINLVGSVATLTITTALTTGSVPFIGASGALSQDNANLFFDDTNNRLGINTNAPTTALDVFGSGIIGRLNGTSTNNAFLGFASAGSNKWSIGNVQSDHRFRIYNEATTSELVSVLSTGEFGIGIANPTTKFHIDGAATALIANLDANVSVAKSISFRSDNSNRINLEVSGTESGSNAGANFFLRTYTDAGSLIETPFSIVRSTGVTTIKSLTLTNALSIANGGTGSTTQNFVDLTTAQTIAGAKIFTSIVQFGASSGYTTATEGQFFSKGGGSMFTANLLSAGFGKHFTMQRNDVEKFSIGLNGSDNLAFINSSGTPIANISSTGAATFNSSVTAAGGNSPTLGFQLTTISGSSTPRITSDSANATVIRTGASGAPVVINNFANSAELVRFADGGNVGIGDNNPGELLVLKKSTYPTIKLIETTDNFSGYLQYHSDANEFRLLTITNHPIILSVNDAERMKLTTVGNTELVKTGIAGVSNTYGNNLNFRLTQSNGQSVISAGIAAQGKASWGGDLVFLTHPANGTPDDNYTERMRITSAGTILIGTTTDNGQKFQINGALFLNSSILLEGTNIQYRRHGSSDGVELTAGPGGVYLDYGMTSWGSLSDERFKNIDSEILNATESIMTLRAVKYSLKDDKRNKINLGLIAQDVVKVFPEAVDIQNNEIGTMGVRYTELIPVLVKAIQEQQMQIEELKVLIKNK